MEIKTKRLLLRPPRKSDILSVVEGINNINVSKWLLVVPYPYRKKDAIEWLTRVNKKWKKKEQEDYQFGIIRKEDGKYLGAMGVHHVDKRQGTATLGYWIAENYWRNGYGSEALESVMDFVFRKLKLRRLEAGVLKGNPSSGKLLEKFGFKLEGTKRKAVIPKATGKIADEYIYGLLKEEYKK